MRVSLIAAGALLCATLFVATPTARAEPTLRVLTTSTDLREIARAVGGSEVTVDCVVKGPEDAHYIRARPSLIRAAHSADVLIVIGRDLEMGYASLLREDSRNEKIQKGRLGFIDASEGIVALEVPTGPVDRSMGDVHPSGNPHYLTDPVNSKQVARTIADRFAKIDPDHADGYEKRRAAFERSVDVAMWGAALLAKQPARRLEKRLQRGQLASFLKGRGLEGELGGWAALLAPYAGRKVVSYHGLFVYLLDRFHLVEAAKIEPKPGIDPTPRHTLAVVRTMKSEAARVVLYASYQPERTAKQIAEQGNAVATKLAHMPGALPGSDSYLEAVEMNIRRLASALAATKEK